jgi:uncharacterized membrane protein
MASGDARDLGRLPGFLAAVGLLLSGILEWVHIQTNVFPAADSYCSVADKMDCAAVAASPYAVVLGLPVPVIGLYGFLALYLASRARSVWLLPLSALATLASVGLFALSAFALGTFCLLCEAVHLTAIALFFVVLRRRQALTGTFADRGVQLSVLGFPALLALATWVSIPPYWAAFSYKANPPFPTGLTADGNPWIGAAEPKHVVDEFTDYACPHCKVAAARSLRLLSKHRHVRLVRHQNPRMGCRVGTSACFTARLAVCAAEQGRFWQADRYLFAYADARKRMDLADFSRAVRVDRPQLERCLTAPATYERAERSFRLATKQHVRETPGYLVDGKKVTVDALLDALD